MTEVGELAEAMLYVEKHKHGKMEGRLGRSDIADALADIMWGLYRIAENYNIDLLITKTLEYLPEGPLYYDADQLYNLDKDPGEMQNLSSNPKHAAKLEEMKQEMRKYLASLPGTLSL